MRRGAWGVGLLALLCIAFALVITTSSRTPILQAPDLPSATPTVTQGRETFGPTPSRRPQRNPGPATSLPLDWWVFLNGLLIALAMLLLFILWGSVRRGRRTTQVPANFTPSDLDVLDPDSERRLADAVDAQLTEVHSGAARNAVVACWLALELAVADLGFYQKPSLTSAEFTEEVLGAYALDKEAIRRLAALYREARFSGHSITEHHRQAAAEALTTLRVQMNSRAWRESPAEGASS